MFFGAVCGSIRRMKKDTLQYTPFFSTYPIKPWSQPLITCPDPSVKLKGVPLGILESNSVPSSNDPWKKNIFSRLCYAVKRNRVLAVALNNNSKTFFTRKNVSDTSFSWDYDILTVLGTETTQVATVGESKLWFHPRKEIRFRRKVVIVQCLTLGHAKQLFQLIKCMEVISMKAFRMLFAVTYVL